MSLSVNGSNTNNPYATLQSILQQGSSQSGSSTTPADPLSELLAALGQQNANGTSSTAGSTSSTAGAPSGSCGGPQFGSQTLQALLAQQSSDSSTSQSLLAQLDGDSSASSTDPATGQQTQSTQQTRGHHHHHAEGAGASSAASPGGQSASGSGSVASSGGTTMANRNLIGQLMQIQSQYLSPSSTQSLATV